VKLYLLVAPSIAHEKSLCRSLDLFFFWPTTAFATEGVEAGSEFSASWESQESISIKVCESWCFSETWIWLFSWHEVLGEVVVQHSFTESTKEEERAEEGGRFDNWLVGREEVEVEVEAERVDGECGDTEDDISVTMHRANGDGEWLWRCHVRFRPKHGVMKKQQTHKNLITFNWF
jgi:hypothetical protein